MSVTTLFFSVILTILCAALGAFPLNAENKISLPYADAFSSGVFLGIGLIHLLPDALHLSEKMNVTMILVGSVYILLLLLEHIGRAYQGQHVNKALKFIILAWMMLLLHSLIEGTTLGLMSLKQYAWLLLFGICAHKSAAGFALAQYLTKSFKNITSWTLYLLFIISTPAGILLGAHLQGTLDFYQPFMSYFLAIAAAMFLYLGTLHGLSNAILVKTCCNLKQFTAMIIGFILIALSALLI